MRISYYVLSAERRQLQKEVVKRAITSIQGPVGFYERWPGEEPRLTITKEARAKWRQFCVLVEGDEARKRMCHQDYEQSASACKRFQVNLCWAGVHNAACHVEGEHGGSVTLIGGEFRLREERAEAEERLHRFLEDQNISSEQRAAFCDAWLRVPEVSEATVQNQILRELELAGHSYLYSLRQLSQFRYSTDLVTHDLVILVQSLIGAIEVLQIELKGAVKIGKKWETRFEEIIQTCERYYAYLEARLGSLGEPEYTYQPLAQLIYDCVDLYRPKAEKRGIDFRVDLQKAQYDDGQVRVPHIRAARAYLNRAFHNAIDNAVKYSFDGTAHQSRWIEIAGQYEIRQKLPGYAIHISNLGIGIEEDELERVFEPGYQGRRRLGEFRSGFGMGLTFVRECVEMHGGTVSISSHPQRRTGWLTILSIWLPIHGPMDGVEG
jgi:signal transduction histidine kinase